MKISKLIGKDKVLHSIVKHPDLPYEDNLGIELEIEGIKFPEEGHKFKYWKIKRDGSLRDDGYEMVFRQPFGGKDVISALKEANRFLAPQKENLELGFRTSCHVHVDVRDLSIEQLVSMVLLYIVYEKPLFHMAGHERYHNNFCTPLAKSGRFIRDIVQCLYMDEDEGGYQVLRIFQNWNRYTSCNLHAVAKFGSIEFRLHEGVWEFERLKNWINILLCIKKFALNRNPKDIEIFPEMISRMGFDNFTKEIFGDYSDNLIYGGSDDDVLDGVRIFQDVVYAINLAESEDFLPKSRVKEEDLLTKYIRRNNND